MKLHRSIGILKYSIHDSYYRLVAEIDKEITNYYRALIPKWIKTNPQRYIPHISVVRREVPVNLENWGKYEGRKVVFYYDGIIHNGTVYYWLNVFSKELEFIRKELGLEISSKYTRPPDGWVKCFHTTIGNVKGL